MTREFRIVFIIALIFFIFGLTSFFQLGGFVTPFFLGRIILVLVSLTFLIMNIRIEKSIYLLFAFLAMLSFAITDDFTINYLSEKFQTEILVEISYAEPIVYASFFLFFGFYFTAAFLLQSVQKVKWVALLLSGLVLLSIVLLYFRYYELQNICFSAFLLLFVILVNRLDLPDKSVVKIISALFLLQFLLQVFKYLFRIEELI